MKHSLGAAPRARTLMQLLQRLSWRPLDDPARMYAGVIVICATMLAVALCWSSRGPQ